MTRAVIEQRKREAIALEKGRSLRQDRPRLSETARRLSGLASPRQGWGIPTKIFTMKQGMSQ